MMCKPKNKYIRKQKYNKKYAGKYTKRELNKRINKSLICIAIVVIIIPIQLFLNTTNKIEIQKFEQEELPPSLEFKPLAVKIEPQEIKEIVVKKSVIQSDNYQYVIDYITEQSTAKGLDSDLMLAIARCESGFNPNTKNGTSTATGVFQFIAGTWKWVNKKRGLDWTLENRTDYKKNIDNAIWLMINEGPTHWECFNKNMI